MSWTSREEYIARLAAGCRISVGRAQAATEAALASERVRRRGWFSDDYRISQMEHGEPDPGLGPCELPLTPTPPFWLERNIIERVEYSADDLDYETRELWSNVKKRELGLDQEAVTALLRAEAKKAWNIGKPLKGARDWLRNQDGVKESQICPAIEAVQKEGLLRTRGRPSKTSTYKVARRE